MPFMRNLLAGILISLAVPPAFAQKPPIKFGEIPMDDMVMTTHDKDPSAAAVVLVDFGKTTGFEFERHVRIKILNKEGLGWANVIVPLFSDGRLTKLKASTYNLVAGKIEETEMSKEGVFRENYTGKTDLQKFTLPNVQEGSVIEYSYKVDGYGIPDWEFQKNIPVRWSEYWAIIPQYFTFEKYMQGYLAPSTYEVEDKAMAGYWAKAHHWILKDVPAFKEEPFMTSERDYISKVNFALSYINIPGRAIIEVMGSWSKLNQELLEHEGFGSVIARSHFIKDEVEELTAGITDPMKKIEVIHAYVRQTMEWDGTKDILTEDLKKVVEKKMGTCGDINFMLATMLDKAGFLVDMVVLSTRDHGFIRTYYPMVKQFNYVVCAVRVNGKSILLDATEKFLPYTILPPRCLNGQGLMISKITSDWVPIEAKAKAKTTVTADMVMEDSGALAGKLHFTLEGYDALQIRKEYHSKGEEEYLKSFSKNKNWQIGKSEFQDMKELDLPVRTMHEINIDEHSSGAGNHIYLNPLIHLREEENPFKAATREFPVDFGNPIEKLFTIKINFPDGYVVDEIPKSKVIRLPDGSARYIYNAVQVANTINVTSHFQINKSLYVQTEYAVLREFYNQVIAKQAEQIVFKKKE
jgi:hypothetical protein